MNDWEKVHFDQEGGEMMIGGVSPVTSTMTAFHPVLVAKAMPGAPDGVTALTAPVMRSLSESLTAIASTPAPIRASAPDRITAGATPASADAGSIADEVVSAYSTSVGGKQYSGSVEESGGEYSAWVPNLARATVTGPSEQAAENNLYARINELV